MKIGIRYFVEFPEDLKIKKIEKGDWIDLRAAEDVTLKKGEFKLIRLGVGMILPPGYEAHVCPRSSTFKNFHIIETNSMGIIDETYCGENSETGEKDEWFFPAYAVEPTVIHKYDRICQFRIVEKMPEIELIEVSKLNEKVRGGHGSTGIK